MHGDKVDFRNHVVARKVLAHENTPRCRVGSCTRGSCCEKPFFTNRQQVAIVQGFHKGRHFLQPLLQVGNAVGDLPCLTTGLVDEAPTQDGGIILVQPSIDHVASFNDGLDVALVHLFAVFIGVEKGVASGLIVLAHLVEILYTQRGFGVEVLV